MSHSAYLYPYLLGDEWDRLPSSIRAAHYTGRPMRLSGQFRIQAADTPVLRSVCRILRLPTRSETVPAILEIAACGPRETWSRQLGRWRFQTTQEAKGPHLAERTALWELRLRLFCEDTRLRYVQERFLLRMAGVTVPIPQWLSPKIHATESESGDDSQLEVHVELTTPGGRLLLSYGGFLRLEVPS